MRSAEGGTAQEHGECGSSGEPDNAGRWVMAAGGEHEGHELTDEGHTTPDGGGRRPQHAHAGAAWEVMAAGLVYSPVRRADEVARVRVRVEKPAGLGVRVRARVRAYGCPLVYQS